MDTTLTYGFTHLAIKVKDLQRTLEFYQSVFDMQLMYHEKELIQLNTPGCNDILVFELDDENFAGKAGGITHFGFRLRSPSGLEEIYKKLIAAGTTIIDKGEFVPGSPYLFCKDPDGYTVEVWYEV